MTLLFAASQAKAEDGQAEKYSKGELVNSVIINYFIGKKNIEIRLKAAQLKKIECYLKQI